VLDVGSPAEVIERRQLKVAELQVDDAAKAATLLRQRPEVDEISHFGHTLRLATLKGADPVALAEQVLTPAGLQIASARPARVTVEDAFVSMVRHEGQPASEAAR
jgi:hypothetical protein